MLVVSIGACAVPSTPAAPPAATFAQPLNSGGLRFVLSSSAFDQGSSIPLKYTCSGSSVSPQLQWSGAPSNTGSFVLIVDDPDAPGGTFTHWVAFDIPSTQTQINEGAPTAGVAGKNGTGRTGYAGPCPPSGIHRYFFTLSALDVATLGLKQGASRSDVEKAMSGHILATAQLMGRFAT
jgi:Raf kinase inhibitor-like YbhB/YbcL family protein